MDIQLRDVCKNFRVNETLIPVLRGISLQVEQGEFVVIFGPSGSGKSTLLQIIGCLDHWDSGSYRLGEQCVEALREKDLAQLRLQHLGFVFQSYNLVPRLNALRNVELPLIYAGASPAMRREQAYAALDRVGLGSRSAHSPSQLSGGEQQRVAIARALVNDPAILILDEATGNLDARTSDQIMQLVSDLNALGKTIVAVTHDPAVARYARRVLHLDEGVLH